MSKQSPLVTYRGFPVNLGQVIFFMVWLLFVDGFRREDVCSGWSLLPKSFIGIMLVVGDVGMAVLSYPSLFDPSRSPILAVNNWETTLTQQYLAYALIFVGGTFVWFVYFFYLLFATARKFRRMVYLQTRYRQLSFRFFFLQSILVAGAYLIQYVYFLTRDIIRRSFTNPLEVSNFINSLNSLLLLQTQPTGKILFLAIFIYLLLYLHLPPSHFSGSTLITTFHVTFEYEHRALIRQLKHLMQERKRKKERRLLWRRRQQEGANAGVDGETFDEQEDNKGSSKPTLNPVVLFANWFEQRREVRPLL